MANAVGTYTYNFVGTLGHIQEENQPAQFSTYKSKIGKEPLTILSLFQFKLQEQLAPRIDQIELESKGSYTNYIKLYDTANNCIFEKLDDKSYDIYPIALNVGSYVLEYHYQYSEMTVPLVMEVKNQTYRINFSVTHSYPPTKKYTITDVINRVLRLAEPLKATKVNGSWQCAEPRFRLNEEQAEKFSHIESPEFVFTKCTLREMLQQVGSFIHAEPRLKNGVIYYEEYGGNEYVSDEIKALPYTQLVHRTNVENYCNKLDTSAENLINQIANKQGVIVEPYANGFKSVRAESLYSRIDEESLCIETKYPIYQIIKAECNWNNEVIDITPYVYEKSQYDTLTTDGGTYPYAKDYAIFYTQGQKNIYGLVHKSQHAVNSSFNSYSIKNILKMATGNTSLDISSGNNEYPNLAFRITYLPLYGARIETHKSCIGGKPRTRVYNQNDNIIETQYYGENLKGTVARMGNVDKSITYYADSLRKIPKPGQLWDDDYYVADVTCEYQRNLIKVQVSLSKDFNRLSEYIGIKSEKRCYEVSEKQAYKRDTVITNYVVFGKKVRENNSRYPLLTSSPIYFLDGTLKGQTKNKITAVVTKTESNQDMVLPVISSAMGNSLLFTFSFADNYSAGMRSIRQENGSVNGYFAENTPYCDFYGRKEVLQFSLMDNVNIDVDFPSVPGVSPLQEQLIEQLLRSGIKGTLPLVNGVDYENNILGTGFENNAIYYSKDSREIPQITVEIAYVSTDSSYVIGSALARNCSLVTGSNRGRRVFFSTKRINKFSQKVDITEMTQGSVALELKVLNGRYSWCLCVDCDNNQNNTFKSWVVVDNNSNLLIGRNAEFSGANIEDICCVSMVSQTENLTIEN